MDEPEEEPLDWFPIESFGGEDVWRWVLLRDEEGRQHYGGRFEAGWFAFVDGQHILLDGFEPVEWAEAPGGPEAWA